MSLINYADFAFPSEDEHYQDEHHLDEDDLIETDGDEGEISDHSPDSDEYASFFTDYEKFQFDQLRWHGIPNTRKYNIVKKKGKGEGEEEEKERRAKEDKPKAGPKPRRSKSVVSSVQGVPDGEGIHFDIGGDLWHTYMKKDIYISGKQEEERATFHHWIRHGLTKIENAKGTYDFPRKRGVGNYDVTCFNEVEAHWGLMRAHYAPIMFEWERKNRVQPDYQLGNLYYQDLLVIDYWRTPVRNFREIPLVISSAFEGGYMEPAMRLHSEIAFEDIRARMPPFVTTKKKDHIVVRSLSKASTLSGRSRHFREDAGAISWDKREGSPNIRAFIESIVQPVDNSTRGSRDLTKDEVKRLRLMNHGTKPSRAKPGTTKESKEKYIAKTRKRAGIALAPDSSQDSEDKNVNHQRLGVEAQSAGDKIDDDQELGAEQKDVILAWGDDNQQPTDKRWISDFLVDDDDLYDDREYNLVGEPMASVKDSNKQDEEPTAVEMGDDYDYLYEDDRNQVMDDPIASIKDIDHQSDESTVAEVGDTALPRFVFCCTGAPFLQSMTEQQALTHPMVNMSDPRNPVPKLSVEVQAIRDALQVTIDHFKEFLGFEPMVSEGSNYISEYCNIQDQIDEVYGDVATALRRLGYWEGTIFDWQQAEILDDPCIGRKQPFGPSFLPAASTDFRG